MNILTTIEALPVAVGGLDRHLTTGRAKHKMFTLDNYSAHLDPEVEKALFEKGYILVLLDRGITGDTKVNDTAL